MKKEIPASRTTAPATIRIASLLDSVLEPEELVEELVMTVGWAAVVVGAGETGRPGTAGWCLATA